MRSLRFGLLLPLVFAFAGCSNEPTAVTTGPANVAAAATRPRTSTPLSLSIVSVSPETFSVTGGRAAWQVLEVAYTILDPAKVQSARVEVYAREIGVISRMDVPVQASGTVRFLVDPQGPSDFGPTVRFRASCPEGTTEWYELGQEPLPYEDRMGDTLRITNVNPSSIKEGPDESEDSNQRGVGTRVSIYGKKLSAACSIESQVDGSPVQLNNPLFFNGHFEGLLMRRDLSYRSVSPRYVELKFSIRGPGIGQVAIKNMKIGR
jgi:hypothetical protein